MKKIIAVVAVAAALVMTLALGACASQSSLVVDSDETGVHAVAENGPEGTSSGELTVPENYGICVNHIVNKGSFHVTITDDSGAIVFDEDLTDNIADNIPVNGHFNVTVSAQGAEGTVDVIPYDIAMMEQSNAALNADLAEAGLNAEELGIANPWTPADSADAAGEAAGFGPFALPAEGTKVEGGEIHWFAYQSMPLLAQADGTVGSADLTVRKGVNRPGDQEVSYDPSDVSGDYNEYKFNWETTAGDFQVKCFGNVEGQAMKALWASDNFSYSINVRGQGDVYDTYGLSNADIAAIAGAIQ